MQLDTDPWSGMLRRSSWSMMPELPPVHTQNQTSLPIESVSSMKLGLAEMADMNAARSSRPPRLAALIGDVNDSSHCPHSSISSRATRRAAVAFGRSMWSSGWSHASQQPARTGALSRRCFFGSSKIMGRIFFHSCTGSCRRSLFWHSKVEGGRSNAIRESSKLAAVWSLLYWPTPPNNKVQNRCYKQLAKNVTLIITKHKCAFFGYINRNRYYILSYPTKQLKFIYPGFRPKRSAITICD